MKCYTRKHASSHHLLSSQKLLDWKQTGVHVFSDYVYIIVVAEENMFVFKPTDPILGEAPGNRAATPLQPWIRTNSSFRTNGCFSARWFNLRTSSNWGVQNILHHVAQLISLARMESLSFCGPSPGQFKVNQSKLTHGCHLYHPALRIAPNLSKSIQILFSQELLLSPGLVGAVYHVLFIGQ